MRTALTLCVLTSLTLASCSTRPRAEDLPASAELNAPASWQIIRVLPHVHSPISWDACDQKGVSESGVINESCLRSLLDGLCENRVDFVFLTDHPDRLSQYSLPSLVFSDWGVNWSPDSNSGHALGHYGQCSNGHESVISPGVEGSVAAIALKDHLISSDSESLQESYEASDLGALADRLRSESGAQVFGVHPESQSLDSLRALQPSWIESFNLHALMDPEIRAGALGLPPLSVFPSILSFLVDPYDQLNPDSLFLHFLETPSRYFEIWNQLLRTEGGAFARLPAWASSDSHEYLLPKKGADDRRLDAHSRLFRLVMNHLLVSEGTVQAVLEALEEGRGWSVFEALGTPSGMDFYWLNLASGVRGEVGSSPLIGSLTEGVLRIQLPQVLKAASLQWGLEPEIRIRLWHLPENETEEKLVATSTDASVEYVPVASGSYRAEVLLVPHHLRGWAAPFSERSEQVFPWILTNRIHLRVGGP